MSSFTRKLRFCRCFDGTSYFKPRGIPWDSLQVNDLALDELEAVHLCEFDKLEQAVAAIKMKISTSTLQHLPYSGRKEIINALYNSKALKISKHKDITEYVEPVLCKRTANQRFKRRWCIKTPILNKAQNE